MKWLDLSDYKLRLYLVETANGRMLLARGETAVNDEVLSQLGFTRTPRGQWSRLADIPVSWIREAFPKLRMVEVPRDHVVLVTPASRERARAEAILADRETRRAPPEVAAPGAASEAEEAEAPQTARVGPDAPERASVEGDAVETGEGEISPPSSEGPEGDSAADRHEEGMPSADVEDEGEGEIEIAEAPEGAHQEGSDDEQPGDDRAIDGRGPGDVAADQRPLPGVAGERAEEDAAGAPGLGETAPAEPGPDAAELGGEGADAGGGADGIEGARLPNYRLTDADYKDLTRFATFTQNEDKHPAHWARDAVRTLTTVTNEFKCRPDEVVGLLPDEGAKLLGLGTWNSEVIDLMARLDPERKLFDAEAKAFAVDTETTGAQSMVTPALAKGLWRILERLGVERGHVLVPACGPGLLPALRPEDPVDENGMPMPRYQFTLTERDPMMGAIAGMLMPQATLHAQAFEETPIADGSVDAVTGMIPVGYARVHDPRYARLKPAFHDYAIARSIDKLRPGGVFAALVPSAFLDRVPTATRKHVAERADLLSVTRLPPTLLPDMGDANIAKRRPPYDLVVFRRRVPGEGSHPEAIAEWIRSVPLDDRVLEGWIPKEPDPETADAADGKDKEDPRIPLYANEAFARHPDRARLLSLPISTAHGEPELAEPAAWHARAQRFETATGTPSLMPALIDGATGGEPVTRQFHWDLERSISTSQREAKVAKGFEKIIEAIPSNVHAPCDLPIEAMDTRGADRAADPAVRTGFSLHGEGSYVVREGPDGKPMLGVVELGEEVPAELPRATTRRVLDLVKVRDLAVAVVDQQLTESDDARGDALRAELNAAYDAFVARHGPINASKVARVLQDEPTAALLFSLEDYDDITGVATKTEIFSGRVIAPPSARTDIGAPSDALLVSLDRYGQVVPEFVARVCGRSWEDCLEELEGELLFHDPESGQFIHRESYLSGQVRAKLRVAEAAAEADPRYEPNVRELKEVLPPDLGPGEIHVNLGAPWVPKSIYRDFIVHAVNHAATHNGIDCPEKLRENLRLDFNETTGSWIVRMPTLPVRLRSQDSLFGNRRSQIQRVIEATINGRLITVRDKDPKTEKYVINVPATTAAHAFQAALRQEFDTWVMDNPERAELIARAYNNSVNNAVPRTYDGQHLTLPGLSISRRMRPKQLDGIWRVLQSSSTLVAHKVGVGKTGVLVGSGLELKRLGLAKRAAIAVPAGNLSDFLRESVRFFPGARVLALRSEDLAPERRTRTRAKIESVPWDLIVMTHEALERLPLSPEVMREVYDALETDLQNAIDRENNRVVTQMSTAGKQAKGHDWAMSANARQIKQRMESLRQSFNEIIEGVEGDREAPPICLDELGVDALLVDEAHTYKNLQTYTSMANVPGVSTSGSNRAFDMLVKSHWLRETGGRLVFSTGTPLTNTMSEFYNMAKYLAPEVLEQRGIDSFDAWAATFGRVVPVIERDPSGTGYRLAQRFAEFVNLPELIGLMSQFTDAVTHDQAGIKLPEPDRTTETLEPGEALTLYKRALAERAARGRAQTGRGKHVVVGNDNILKIMTDGRKASLDMRLIEPNLPQSVFGETKAARVAENVVKEYRASMELKGAQIVFSDLGVPNAPNTPPSEQRWSIYEDIRDELVARGIPEQEIAFIHDVKNDAQRDRLYDAVRRGDVRVILGSSKKLGTGTNIQDRLVAGHHVDAPWTPAMVEQRDGRVVRDGNIFGNVRLYTYVRHNSFDEMTWEALRRKAGFIRQAMSFDKRIERKMSEELEPSYEDILAAASGNPLLKEKCETDKLVQELEIIRDLHRRASSNISGRLKWREHDLVRYQEELEAHRQLLAHIEPVEEGVFSIEIDGHDAPLTDYKEAAKALRDLVQDASTFSAYRGSHGKIAVFRGLDIHFRNSFDGGTLYATPKGVEFKRHTTDFMTLGNGPDVLKSPLAVIGRALGLQKATLTRYENRVEATEREIEALTRQVGGFARQDELNEAYSRQAAINEQLAQMDIGEGATSFVGAEKEWEQFVATHALPEPELPRVHAMGMR